MNDQSQTGQAPLESEHDARSDLNTASIRRYLEGVQILDDPIDGQALIDAKEEIAEYVEVHARSAALSLEILARSLPGSAELGRPLRVLELGGAPYFFSALMLRHFDIELTAANVEAAAWPGEAAGLSRGKVILGVPPQSEDRAKSERQAGSVEQKKVEIEVAVFNIEKDPFPFEDDSFDLVLCMEVLEHLAYSPSHMLAESHRVLRPDGAYFLTVPNFINIKRMVNMIFNRPTEYPYSGYGIYGRHAREFAPFEVQKLMEACNYKVETLETANVWPTFKNSRIKGMGNAVLNGLTALPIPFLAAKREYVLCLARPFGEPLAAYPDWLYVHRHLYPDPPNGVAKATQ